LWLQAASATAAQLKASTRIMRCMKIPSRTNDAANYASAVRQPWLMFMSAMDYKQGERCLRDK
jgi:hypothetical protein